MLHFSPLSASYHTVCVCAFTSVSPQAQSMFLLKDHLKITWRLRDQDADHKPAERSWRNILTSVTYILVSPAFNSSSAPLWLAAWRCRRRALRCEICLQEMNRGSCRETSAAPSQHVLRHEGIIQFWFGLTPQDQCSSSISSYGLINKRCRHMPPDKNPSPASHQAQRKKLHVDLS